MPIQWLDVILVGIMLVSGFLAMLRGLTREMLSIMSWALAALAALFVYPIYRDRVRLYIEPQTLADGVLIVSVFAIVLVVVSLVTIRLSDRVLDSRVGAIDRTLGFVFGLVRGLILVVIAYELYIAIVPKESLPGWVTQARSLPAIEATGRAILSLLPDNPASIFQKKEKEPKERQGSAPTRDKLATLSPHGNCILAGRSGIQTVRAAWHDGTRTRTLYG